MSSVLHIYGVLNGSFYSFKWLYGHCFHYISLNHYILVMRNICNKFSHGLLTFKMFEIVFFQMFEFCMCLSVPKFNKSDTDGTVLCFKSFFFNQKCFALVRGYLAEKIFHRGYITEKRLRTTALGGVEVRVVVDWAEFTTFCSLLRTWAFTLLN